MTVVGQPDPGRPRAIHPLRASAIVALALAVFGVLAACGAGSESSSDATFSYVIPAGAGDRINSGEPLDILPAQLVAELDETIQIVNNDDRAHLLGPWFVGAGETLRERFTVPGTYEGACSIHPSGGFAVIVNP